MSDCRNAFGIVGAICVVALGVQPLALGQPFDCNGNGVPDDVDIAKGTSQDCNKNSIPDECDVLVIEQIVTTEADVALSVFAADLDGDGDLDVLSASQTDNKIAWYENTDGLGSFGPQQIITISADGAISVFAADLDGDGDFDALSASEFDDKIAWYENTDGLGTFGPQQIITTSADGAVSVFAVDLDGDGDTDILSASWIDNKIAWYENTDGLGSFGPQQVVTTAAEGPSSVFAADLDGDCDADILSASYFDDKIAWNENTDGLGSFGPQQIITTAACGAEAALAADVDGDGDADVVSASDCDNKIAWYENTDGLGSFGPQQIITTDVDRPWSAFVADMDGDEDLDVLSASVEDDTIAWYENTDGLGSFGPQQIITTAPNGVVSIFATDLDGDGDTDVLSASIWDDKIAWYAIPRLIDCNANAIPDECDIDEGTSLDCSGNGIPDECDIAEGTNKDCNQNGIPDQCDLASGIGDCNENGIPDECDLVLIEQIITTAAAGAYSVFAADLDGDGDADVLSASSFDDKIAWYENTDGRGSFGSQQIITTAANSAVSVFAADLDGDGDADALSASFSDAKIAWYENTDGLGSFGPQQIITTAASGAWSVFAADLDSDGDLDILSASHSDHSIEWYENTDGLGSFGPQRIISTEVDGPYSVFATDLDGDGDIDLLSASFWDNKIAWYENTDGLGSFGHQRIITATANGARTVFATDLDGDGDSDALSASWLDSKIAWYENTDGLGSFGQQQIITTAATGAWSVFAADLDGDGDADALSASDDDDTVAWYENTDGLGSFGPQRILTTAADGARSVFAADLDGDGDPDVLAASVNDFKIAWHAIPSEDCNDNEIPDECDIAGGTSPDDNGNGVPDECETCEGDANGDGLVDPLDSGFVLARFGCPVGTGDPNCDIADQNDDGLVDPLDVGYVLARFGECS